MRECAKHYNELDGREHWV